MTPLADDEELCLPERHMFRLSLLLLLLLPLAANAQAKKYALLVGVNKYDHTAMNQPEPLKYAEADVKELEQLLKKSGYTVDLLIGEKATRAAIAEKIAGLSAKGNSDGVVLVALSGHGIQLEQDDEAYYCPYDARMREAVRDGRKLTDMRGNALIEPDPRTLIKLTDIVVAFKLSPAGSRVLLADCCRNDPTSGRSPRAVGSGIRPDQLPDRTAVILSCSQGQRAWEDKKWGHGAFFYHVLAGLSQGESSASALTAYLEKNVAKDVKETVRDAPDQKPRPLINGSLDLGIVASETAVRPKEKEPKETTTNVPGAGAAGSMKPRDLGSTPRTLDSTRGSIAAAEARAIQKAWADSLGLDLPLKVDVGGKAMEFTLIPPGVFMMGSQRRVNITRPFLMSVCEVKQSEYAAIMPSNPSWFRKKGGVEKIKELANIANTDDFPVETVSWDNAQEFTAKLMNACKNSLPNRKITVRLPTEAEWEFAGRAGSTRQFQNEQAELKASDANISPRNLRRTEKCGAFEANPLGLKDLHGNVAEWCQDGYVETLASFEVFDPVERPREEFVVRGGSWLDGSDKCALSWRAKYRRDYSSHSIGFRVVIELITPK